MVGRDPLLYFCQPSKTRVFIIQANGKKTINAIFNGTASTRGMPVVWLFFPHTQTPIVLCF